MTIGQRIKQRREELCISQDELAKKIGYKSRSSINKIELDLYNLKQSKIKAIADALDTTPSYIMGWDELKEYDEFIKKEIKNERLLNNYLKSIGYSIREDFGKAIKDEYGNVIEPEYHKYILVKDGITATFMGDEWNNFKEEIQKTVDYQVWKKAGN